MPNVLPPKRILFGYSHSHVQYIPPQANTTTALWELHWTGKLETTYLEVAFIVAGDFNKANLRKTLLKFYQHIDCSTCSGKTATPPFKMPTRPFPALPSANRITTPFCSSLPLGINSNRKYPC